MKPVEKFLNKHIPQVEKIQLLHGDASHRRYSRVYTGSSSVILCQDNPWEQAGASDTEIVNQLFAANGIPVPAIIAAENHSGLLLFTDAGDDHVEAVVQRFAGDTREIVTLYSKLVHIMIRIQGIQQKVFPFKRGFNRSKLDYEFGFFIEHGLKGYFKTAVSDMELSFLREQFSTISELLDRDAEFVPCHRDYHSRNILLLENNPVIIDYQDAMLGLPQYDAVSLLRDSRVCLKDNAVKSLKDLHYELLRETNLYAGSRDRYEHYFRLMAFQRNIKALGTFTYQTNHGNSGFEKNISPILKYLPDYIDCDPVLESCWRILKPCLEDR